MIYDFEIDNYEVDDLLRFFNLSPSGKFSLKELETRKKEMENKILFQSELPMEVKQNVIHFFDEANFKLQQYSSNPTLLQKRKRKNENNDQNNNKNEEEEEEDDEFSHLLSFVNPMEDRQRRGFSKALQMTKEGKKYEMNKLIGNDTYISDVQPTYQTEQETKDELEELDVTFQNRSKISETSLYPPPFIDSHPIASKPYTKFVYTENDGPYQGFLNPLQRRIVTRVLSIDSRFRTNYAKTNPNNFTMLLNSPLEKVVSMRLVSLELPRMWYTISASLKNNVFFVELYNMADYPDSVQKVEFPDGNYTNQDLVNYMNNYFTNIGQGLDYLRFDVNANNSKSYFFVKSNPAVDTILPYDPANAHYSPLFYYVLIFPTASSLSAGSYSGLLGTGSAGSRSCESTNPLTLNEKNQGNVNSDYGFGLYLGYKRQKYEGKQENQFEDNFSQTPSVILYGIVVSESSCGISIDNYIFLSVNDFNKNFNSNTVLVQLENSFMGNNILGRIPLTTLPDSLLINNPSDENFKTRDYFGPVKISKLQISLVNKYGREINLLQNDFSLALEFNVLYSS